MLLVPDVGHQRIAVTTSTIANWRALASLPASSATVVRGAAVRTARRWWHLVRRRRNVGSRHRRVASQATTGNDACRRTDPRRRARTRATGSRSTSGARHGCVSLRKVAARSAGVGVVVGKSMSSSSWSRVVEIVGVARRARNRPDAGIRRRPRGRAYVVDSREPEDLEQQREGIGANLAHVGDTSASASRPMPGDQRLQCRLHRRPATAAGPPAAEAVPRSSPRCRVCRPTRARESPALVRSRETVIRLHLHVTTVRMNSPTKSSSVPGTSARFMVSASAMSFAAALGRRRTNSV